MVVREVLCTAWGLRALMAAKMKRRRRQLELHASERNEAFYDHTEEPRSQYNTVVVFEWVATYPTTTEIITRISMATTYVCKYCNLVVFE